MVVDPWVRAAARRRGADSRVWADMASWRAGCTHWRISSRRGAGPGGRRIRSRDRPAQVHYFCSSTTPSADSAQTVPAIAVCTTNQTNWRTGWVTNLWQRRCPVPSVSEHRTDVTALLFLELAKVRVVVMRKWHREVAGLAVQDHQLVNVPLWIVMCAPAL